MEFMPGQLTLTEEQVRQIFRDEIRAWEIEVCRQIDAGHDSPEEVN